MSICLSYSKVLLALLLLSSLFRAFISFTGLRCCCVLYTNAGPASIVVVYHILVMCTVWRNVRETMDEMRGDGGGRPVESWSISNKKGEKKQRADENKREKTTTTTLRDKKDKGPSQLGCDSQQHSSNAEEPFRKKKKRFYLLLSAIYAQSSLFLFIVSNIHLVSFCSLSLSLCIVALYLEVTRMTLLLLAKKKIVKTVAGWGETYVYYLPFDE